MTGGLRSALVGTLALLVASCGSGSSTSSRPSTLSSPNPAAAASSPDTAPLSGGVPPGAAPSSAPPATPPRPADLSARPLVWFAPLPPLPIGPGRPYTGSDDFMDLFAADAPWTLAAERVDVFKLYGEWVDVADADDLRTAVEGVRDRDLVLAVEAGPLDPPTDCGQGVEGFAGSASGRRLAERIKSAGGVLQVIALDEPWYFGHVYDGPSACHWDVERVAAGVAEFIAAVRAEFPWVVVGDIEPTPAPVDAAGLAEWMDAYQAAVGEPMAFLHLDADWSSPGWSGLAIEIEQAGAARGVPVGMLYNGGTAPTGERWVQLAGQRALDHEDRDGASPDHIVFQSWNDHPDRVLPESDPLSFTALINRYFDDRATLGLAEPVDDLAWHRPVSASAALEESPATNAVDGDHDTIWSSGAGPPGWIDVDLGAAVAVSEIRLTVAQYPAGPTEHLVWGRVDEGAEPVELGRLVGDTADTLVLVLESPGTWPAVRFVRVETVASPSWVAWREIEISAD